MKNKLNQSVFKPVKHLLFILWIILFPVTLQAQQDKVLFEAAYQEQLRMLKGQVPINFKRAVFITENAYDKGTGNYHVFCNNISATGKQLKEMIRVKGIQGFKTAGNWATFTYMTDALPANNNKPFTYDFDDFMGDKDWRKMFVSKLMQTHKGNCHSLPYYYKILCEEIGASASLALAPNHVYIKHLDEKNQWTNIELTNGGFPRDQWIIKEMAITVDAIKKGTYMSPLTAKESIAMTMFDLASGYEAKYGKDAFVLKAVNTALTYYPKCVPLLQFKANCIDAQIKKEKKKVKPDGSYLASQITLYKSIVGKIDQTGYKDMPPELYKEWVKSVEKEKARQGIVSNIKLK